jgi:hypothetical protein
VVHHDTGYTLEFKTNVTAAQLWAPVPGTPVPVAGQFTVSNSAAPVQKIYRLRNP